MTQNNRLDDYRIEWRPNTKQIEDANITAFLSKHGLLNYDSLHAKSLKNPDWFYPAVLEELNVRWYEKYTNLANQDDGIAWTKWFEGAKTNVLHYTIEQHIENGKGSHPALIWEAENGETVELTYSELNDKVTAFAAGLKELGIDKGDRVGIYLPPIAEVQIAFFACAKIGAVVIPMFSGYAADAISTRLNDSGAKALITADGFSRRGKQIEVKHTADEAAHQSPTVKHVIVVEHTKQQINWNDSQDVWFHDLLKYDAQVPTEVLDVDDPLMIIYTSGTTGKPKGTVHTHAGFPIKSAIDMYFCFDVKQNDRIFWLTDFGWMMGPWLFLGAAVHGSTIVFYEGSPDYPTCNRLWNLIEKHRISIFGVAPTVIRSLMTSKDIEIREEAVSSLRILGSTGEAWSEKPWQWFLNEVGKGRCPIINYSGGTEVSGGIIGCYPTMPLKPCGFHGPIPGMEAKIVGPDGKEATNGVIGDMTLWKAFVGMTKSFWQDDERYVKTYWSQWENIWTHGDLVGRDKDGYWYILGRSDDTLKIAGKRIGPSEIEAALLSHDSVAEAAAIGVPHKIKGQVAVVFVTLKEEATIKELSLQAQAKLGKALKPQEIIPISGLPKTQSGKVARRLLRTKYLGEPLGDVSTLSNPAILDEVPSIQYN
ncbi:AMP-binding protein [Sediminibacillus massiliensis]|uniref:AMP-binding protein n=1 Tax=Sediminibacillus massiliensis TaxID=1926277 RepID=UPI00098865D5|nr:AMP-binding protein [Sediminibacillus massiliensis]